MDVRSLGLGLVWVGAVLLVLVLVHRLRQGAFGGDAFDQGPPVPRWAMLAAAAGAGCALSGAVLTVWSCL